MTEKPLKVLKIPTSFPLPKPYSPSERKTPAFQKRTPYEPKFLFPYDHEENLPIATTTSSRACPICGDEDGISKGYGRRFSFFISNSVLLDRPKQGENFSLEGLDVPAELAKTRFWWQAFLDDKLEEDYRYADVRGFALNDLLACPNISCRSKLETKIRNKGRNERSKSNIKDFHPVKDHAHTKRAEAKLHCHDRKWRAKHGK
jgi:hypothetical protein